MAPSSSSEGREREGGRISPISLSKAERGEEEGDATAKSEKRGEEKRYSFDRAREKME